MAFSLPTMFSQFWEGCSTFH